MAISENVLNENCGSSTDKVNSVPLHVKQAHGGGGSVAVPYLTLALEDRGW